LGRISNQERDFTQDGSLTATEAFIKKVASVWRVEKPVAIYNDVWRIKPPTSREFFEKYIGEPLYPIQQVFCDEMFGLDPEKFRDTRWTTGLCYWGKGSGKDRTIAKLFVYSACLLSCLNNPQEFLGLGQGSPVDLCNVSIDADQAKDVFFENLKGLVRRTIDPETGKNWFATRNWWIDTNGAVKYMDIREKKAIQTNEIDFGRGIKAHSLNSERYTGEGLTLLFAAFDEIGAFRPSKALGNRYDKKKGLLQSLTETVTSRSKYGAVFVFSYKYYEGCPMSVVVEKEKIRKQKGLISSTFISEAATWEVNLAKSKSDFQEIYDKDPETAMMTYECKSSPTSKRGYLIGQRGIISDNTDEQRVNPVIDGRQTTDSPDNIDFYSWFVGEKGLKYHIHIDLAKGKIDEGGDAVGLCLAHPVMLPVKLSDLALQARAGGDTEASYTGAMRKGMWIDLFLQIVAPPSGEVSLQGVRRLIFALIDRGFNLSGVSMDGWNNVEMMQELKRKGINAEVFSVDKTTAPYDTLKSLEYQGLVSRYAHSIYEREIIEIHRDDSGKWNHPVYSALREQLEGLSHGSKDVSDSVAACAAYTMLMPARKVGGDSLYVGFGGNGENIPRKSSEEKQAQLERKCKAQAERFYTDQDEREAD
jgi:hypothetical protein